MPATKKKTAKTKCLTCTNKSHSRGLCNTCLLAARQAIASGDVTEQGLIDAGLMLARKRLGRPGENGFLKALSKSRLRKR